MSGTNAERSGELIRLRRRLDEFRRGSSPGKPLPGWAWSAAARLARRHGVHQTGRALGLEYNKLKRIADGAGVATGHVRRPTRGASAGAVKFVELTGALPVAGACRVRLAGPEGQRLELEMVPSAATEMLLGLCRAGWGRTG